MKTLTVAEKAYLCRWSGGSFIAAWKIERCDDPVPDEMIPVPEHVNKSRADHAVIYGVVRSWLRETKPWTTGTQLTYEITYRNTDDPVSAEPTVLVVQDEAQGRMRLGELNRRGADILPFERIEREALPWKLYVPEADERD